jgi:hypothetical protein
MEDVLTVYQQPEDPKRPLVCLDEKPQTLHGEPREPLPLAPGKPARHDYEYERNGTANLFMIFAPLEGRRRVSVTDRRTALDFAEVIRELVDEEYPEAELITLVMDNLNTHTIGSLYEAFPPAQARRLAQKLDIHHTPKHGGRPLGPGSTWRRSSSRCWAGSASADGSKTGRRSRAKWRHGKRTATVEPPGWIGGSPPTTPASSSSASTPRFKIDGVLALAMD